MNTRPAILFCLSSFLFCLSTAPAADPPAAPWGEAGGPNASLKARLTIATPAPAVGAPLPLRIEINNAAATPLPKASYAVWLLVADTQPLYFTSTHNDAPQILAANETITLNFDAATLDAFRFDPQIQVKDGLPAPKDPKAPAPKSLGKLADLLPTGPVRVKAFIVITKQTEDNLEVKKVDLLASAAVTATIADAPPVDFAKLDAPAKTAFLQKITDGLHGDAVAAKNAHDRALQAGEPAVTHLLTLVDDKKLSPAGQQWLAASLVELKDPRATPALLKILEAAGPGAKVVAYMAPRLKDPKLTDAIQKTAATTKDKDLIAWAIRGLGMNGEKTDPNLLETMVANSDPVGRAQAADILGAHPDPKAIPLLAKLINDPDANVRYRAIASSVDNKRTTEEILSALQKATQSDDPQTAKIAKQALAKLNKK